MKFSEMQSMLLHKVIKHLFRVEFKLEKVVQTCPFLNLDMEEVLNESLVNFKAITETMSF